MGLMASKTLNAEYYRDNNQFEEYIVRFHYDKENFEKVKNTCKIVRTGWDLLGYYRNAAHRNDDNEKRDWEYKTFYVNVHATQEQYEKIKRFPFVTKVEKVIIVMTPGLEENIRRF